MKVLCSRCGKEFTPSAHDSAFIESATQKGMEFMALTCTLCTSSVFYNPQIKETIIPAKSKNKKKSEKLHLTREVKLKQQPKEYQTFIAPFDGSTYFELNNRPWKLYTATELDELIDIDGRLVPRSRSLAAFTPTLREHHGGDGTTDEQEQLFDWKRLEFGFCIGNENGDELFIDLDSKAIYCWYHDGGDVERVANSFADFLAKTSG